MPQAPQATRWPPETCPDCRMPVQQRSGGPYCPHCQSYIWPIKNPRIPEPERRDKISL